MTRGVLGADCGTWGGLRPRPAHLAGPTAGRLHCLLVWVQNGPVVMFQIAARYSGMFQGRVRWGGAHLAHGAAVEKPGVVRRTTRRHP